LFLGESHCSDISSISDRDTPEMRAHKEGLFQVILRWIDEFNGSLPAPEQ
jgi:hypothetical protein